MAAGVAALGDALTGVSGGKQTWYTATSGLVRSVTMERRPHVHLEPLRVIADLAGRMRHVTWGVAGPPGSGPRDLRIDVFDPDERLVASQERRDVRPGDGDRAVLAIPDPVAWDIGVPALYRVEARLIGRR